MTQYISKSALVAEIEKLKLCTMDKHMNFYSEAAEGEYHTLSNLESFLDTLEVIEIGVDIGDPKGDIGETTRMGDLEEAAREAATWHSRVRGDVFFHNDYQKFIEGAKWQKEQLIDKACEWLKENKEHSFIGCEDPCLSGYLTDEFIEDFKKTMEDKL